MANVESGGAGSFLPIGPDPELQSARQRAISQSVAPDTQPPPPEHPAVTYAKNLLSPMGVFGQQNIGNVPQAPPLQFAPPSNAPSLVNTNAQGGSYIGPDLNRIADDPHSLFGRIGQGFANVGNTPLSSAQIPVVSQLAGIFGGGTKIGDVGAMFAPPTTEQLGSNPLTALGPEGNFAGSIGEAVSPAARLAANKIAGGVEAAAAPRLAAAAGKDVPRFADGLSTQGFLDSSQDITKGDMVITPNGRAVRVVENYADGTSKVSYMENPETQTVFKTNDLVHGTNYSGPQTARVLAAQRGGTSRYVVEVGKTRSVIKDTTTGETLPYMFTKAEAAEAKAATLNAPTPSNPFAVPPEASLKAALGYVTKAKASPAGDTVATVVRRAARTNPETVTPEFLAQQADVRTQIDQALATAKLPPTDENATAVAQQLLAQEKARPSLGNQNAQKIRAALGAPEEPPIDFGPEPPAAPPAPPPPTGTGGAMPPDAPLPMGPPKATAKGLAMEALHVITDIPRSLMVIGHLPILRQGLPLMADAIVRGNPAEVPLALGRAFQAVASSPLKSAAITQGFRDTLEQAGLKVGRGGVQISDPIGAIAAREEFGLHSFLAKVPVISNLNRAYPTMLNSLRTGAATDLAKMYEQSGRPIDSARIGHFVNIASGRGDIPAALDTPVMRDALSGIFFGPRLTAASWQMATDTVGALRGAGGDLLSRRALDPVEIAQIRTTAAYVATGVGIMKLANAFGLSIGTDPTKTDFGRITLPDGKRLDLWGPFNENARLIAREITAIQGNLQGKPGYGATTALDTLVSYVRSKLNAGVPTAVGDILAGSTQGGESIPEAYGTPEALRSKLLPLPFAGQEAVSGSSGGPGMEALETGLVAAGATVIDTPPTVHYDGVGTPDTSVDFGTDPVLAEFARMQTADPNWKKQSTLQPPDTVIGSGRNAVKLDKTSAALYVQIVGEQRRKIVSAVIYSAEYQNAPLSRQEVLYDAAVSKADNAADREFLAHGVIDSTDPKVIQAEAVAGFHAQQGNRRQEAYWVALLDRAGKLTPQVKAAINDSNSGAKNPITADQYLHDAPLIHEYLGHVPYGTDTHPIGTPVDWAAAAAAKDAQNARKNELVRSGVQPSLAEVRAQQEIMKSLTSLVQRNLFLNGAQLENPQRKLLAKKYPALASYFQSHSTDPTEADAEYRDYPFGQ